jgi:hypothetical protein
VPGVPGEPDVAFVEPTGSGASELPAPIELQPLMTGSPASRWVRKLRAAASNGTAALSWSWPLYSLN